MTTTEPLAVYDVNDHPTLLGSETHMRLLDWMASQGLDPTDVIRIEIHADGPHARITEYDRAEHGRRPRREPYDVPITTLPPGVGKPPATT